MITEQTLIEMGYAPGRWFAGAIAAAKALDAPTDEEIAAVVASHAPQPTTRRGLRRAGSLPYSVNLAPADDDERDNLAKVCAHMDELMRLPTIVAGAVMPDACPADYGPGTIPVGGVAATREAIHPGMHSADICCSVAVSVFNGDVNPTDLLDVGMKLSHFGAGGRPRGQQIKPHATVMEAFEANPFLRQLTTQAIEHFATQGDGNHFFYVGRVASSGQIALVTHHGSRAPGALLYKAGMAAAETFRRRISPETPAHNAWIPSETREGEDYWRALQTIRDWTKGNHFAVHDLAVEALGLAVVDRFWNEHNFVFRRSDGLFYHAKGATPAWADFAADSSGLTMIPLNMAEPILIARGRDAPGALGFAPHGAGRNLSRTAYLKRRGAQTDAEMIAAQAPGVDVRYFCGIPDVSELPMAYKNAAAIRAQIDGYGLAEVVDAIEPLGNIMAGDWQRDAPWRKKKRARAEGSPA